MVNSRVVYAAVFVACISSSILVLRAAQSESVSRPADGAVIRELLAEVRALRTEIGWIGNASIRSQLLTARLQLQEQRIYTTARQVAEAENEVAGIRERIAETKDISRTGRKKSRASQPRGHGRCATGWQKSELC